jgi:hypothetical protein
MMRNDNLPWRLQNRFADPLRRVVRVLLGGAGVSFLHRVPKNQFSASGRYFANQMAGRV